MKTYTLAIVAGEQSGDTHGGRMVEAFNALAPGSSWFGAGGPTLASAGVEVLVPMERLAVVGIGEVVSRLPVLWREMKRLKEAIGDRRPDALVLVDFPDFNFRLARFARGLGIPVVYYITPQVWAWRKGRTRFLKRNVDRALVIFPFEEEFLRSRGVDALFVGHPLVDTARPDSPLEAFLARHDLDPETARVALLPGSRASEVRRNLPPLLQAASRLLSGERRIVVLVPWAKGLPRELRPEHPIPGVRWIEGEYHDVLGHAHAAAVSSGTATLEAALMGVPFVIVYKVKSTTYAVGKRLVRLPWVGLPNVVLGRAAVPEFIQDAFTGERVAAEVERMLREGEGERRKAELLAGEVARKLGAGRASARAAQALLDFLGNR